MMPARWGTVVLRPLLILLGYAALAGAEPAPEPSTKFDQTHSGWTTVIHRYLNADGDFDYRKLKADAANPAHEFPKYLNGLSNVSKADYESWNKEKQIAFLINAYNAFTVQLILNNYPIESIKDAGSVFKSPWKTDFFSLLEGGIKNLDQIETVYLRKRFDEPRVHTALFSASVSSPALLTTAYQGDLLEWQLDACFAGFLADRNKNRYDDKNDVIYISKVFDWFTPDFDKAYGSLVATVLRFGPLGMSAFAAKNPKIKFVAYDWSLNEPDYDGPSLPEPTPVDLPSPSSIPIPVSN